MEYGNRNYELEHEEYMWVQNRGNISEEQKGVVCKMREKDTQDTKDRREGGIGMHTNKSPKWKWCCMRNISREVM